MNKILEEVYSVALGYAFNQFCNSDFELIRSEFAKIDNCQTIENIDKSYMNYDDLQSYLSHVNEKESIRKKNGVYYTPSDVVDFIVGNSIKLLFDKLTNDNFSQSNYAELPIKSFCYEKTVFDPTCGAGEFLLCALTHKFDLIKNSVEIIDKDKIRKIVNTINGNDINVVSTSITKVRILLKVINTFGAEYIRGLAKILNKNFTTYDYVCSDEIFSKKYDLIIGNPPYVEDSKSGLTLVKKYGNIYANVLDNATQNLHTNGVIGFIIPLSYVSTPRMLSIREIMFKRIPKQNILSYADRPDCLFSNVHQKLCILIGKATRKNEKIFTSNYTYWYKEERKELFQNTMVIDNLFNKDKFIPKLGTINDVNIYSKVSNHETPILKVMSDKDNPVYLNMRAAFWIKCFTKKHDGAEYKEFCCGNEDNMNFVFCLLNSSLFWWFWTTVSDGWHITRKELNEFKVPLDFDVDRVNELRKKLENKLERTKVYVHTKQTEYEYKHKECIKEIIELDDYINNLFGLTKQESEYIKNFSFRYRISGGAKK